MLCRVLHNHSSISVSLPSLYKYLKVSFFIPPQEECKKVEDSSSLAECGSLSTHYWELKIHHCILSLSHPTHPHCLPHNPSPLTWTSSPLWYVAIFPTTSTHMSTPPHLCGLQTNPCGPPNLSLDLSLPSTPKLDVCQCQLRFTCVSRPICHGPTFMASIWSSTTSIKRVPLMRTTRTIRRRMRMLMMMRMKRSQSQTRTTITSPRCKIANTAITMSLTFMLQMESLVPFHQAKSELNNWFNEDFPKVRELTAELSAKSFEAGHLCTKLDLTETTLNTKHQQIAALLEENTRLKASQLDHLCRDLKDQQKQHKVISDRNAQLQMWLGLYHQNLDNTCLQLQSALCELDNIHSELENAQQHLAHIPPPLPHPMEDTSTSSVVAMSPSPSQN